MNSSDFDFQREVDPKYMENEFTEFKYCYDWAEDCKQAHFRVLLSYLEQFRQSFKKAADLKLLQELNHDIQLIETEQDYNKVPAIADYMNLIGIERLMTASEIGGMFGRSACMIGKIANKLNLKTERFGAWFKEITKSGCESQLFKYNLYALNEFKKFLGINDVILITNNQ